MKRLQYHSYGAPDVLHLEDYEPSALTAQQVLVRVKAACVNPVDWKMRAGQLKMMTGKKFPRGMGNDFAGVVEAVGSGVVKFAPGDAVFGAARFNLAGSFAEQLVTEDKHVAVKPPALTFEEAACLPTAGAAAWMGLIDKAHLKPGQTVFINGCLGGVGRAAVQIAKMHGATVTGTCSAAGFEEARLLKVDTIVDYARLNLADYSKSFDVVLDTAVKLSMGDSLKLLRPGGKVLDVHPVPKRMLRGMIGGGYAMIVLAITTDILNELAKAAVAGKFKVSIGKVVPLADAMPALATLEQTGQPKGKLVIAVG